MKELILFLLFTTWTTSNVHAQNQEPRVLSYSQWFEEMEACEDSIYVLSNALLRPNLSTDTIRRDSMVVSAKVLLEHVEFEGFNENDMLHPPHGEDNSIALTNFTFQRDVILKHCKGTLPTIVMGKFQGNLILEHIESPQSKLKIYNVKCSGQISLLDITSMYLGFNYNQVYGSLLIENTNCDQVWLYRDSIYGPTKIDNAKGGSLYLYDSQIQIQHPNPEKEESPLSITNCDLSDVQIAQSHIGLTSVNQFVDIFSNKITDYFGVWDSEIQPITIIRTLRLSSGRLVFGEDMIWGEGIGLFNLEYNRFSYFDWPPLKGKIFTYTQKRQGHNDSEDGILYKGETYDELEDTYLFDRLILAKQQIRNNYLQNGFKKNSNEILIEIRDLETRMWEHEYQKDKSLESYFHWKMNVFLKKFSAYGTNPVIAIIYSLKIILLFGLFYLFFHNDWDIGSKRKIGQRLRFMLTYFQVPKGLSELYQESQSESQAEVTRIQIEGEKSINKIPSSFTRMTSWYVKSNQLSDHLKKRALKKMDILSGTYAELPKNKQRRIALISSSWFILFLVYTVVFKFLNALTLSLNAFTTLGFGTIPTRGVSRYVVIIEGFLGWVLMTIFSVTLISQLIQ